MDWVRLGNSEDLTGTGGVRLRVTQEELAKHSSPQDVWICIRGIYGQFNFIIQKGSS